MQATLDVTALASEIEEAYAARQPIAVPLSARVPGFDLDAAYAVEAELARRRCAAGHRPVGRKVGFANKAMWRALKLDTLVWGRMYDDTVRAASSGDPLPLGRMMAPKIEPEVVLKVARPLDPGEQDAAAILEAVESIALGFELVHCVFADWKFQPPDFVAAYGLHAALVVGEPMAVDASSIPLLIDQLAQFRLRLAKNGEVVAEGSGRNSLRSPALCLGELASAIARREGQEPLATGDLVSTGSLTDAQFVAPGEAWTATVDGIDLPAVSLSFSL